MVKLICVWSPEKETLCNYWVKNAQTPRIWRSLQTPEQLGLWFYSTYRYFLKGDSPYSPPLSLPLPNKAFQLTPRLLHILFLLTSTYEQAFEKSTSKCVSMSENLPLLSPWCRVVQGKGHLRFRPGRRGKGGGLDTTRRGFKTYSNIKWAIN